MNSPYKEIQDRLNAIASIGKIQPGLERVEKALRLFQHPEKSYKGILVAGTKGKGSTAVFIAAGLSALGYSVGLYTSPHLVDVGERILVNGKKVPPSFLEEELKTYEKMWTKRTLPPLSFFEMLTVMAARYFQKMQVDFAVWEVGLGGRLDATNALPRIVNVLTSISRDHTDLLGNTLQKILCEKMAIHRPGTPFVSSRQRKSLLPILQARVSFTDLHLYGKNYHTGNPRRTENGQTFRYYGDSSFPVTIRMHGDFQKENVSTALRVLEVLIGRIPPAVLKGFETVFWPGRMEIIRVPQAGVYPAEDSYLVLDGAHNPYSARALVRSLKSLFPDSRYHFIVGIQATKDYRGILRALERIAQEFLFVEVPEAIHPLSPQVLAKNTRIPNRVVPLTESLQIAQTPHSSSPGDVWCITGSLYLVGAARYLLNLPWLPPYGDS